MGQDLLLLGPGCPTSSPPTPPPHRQLEFWLGSVGSHAAVSSNERGRATEGVGEAAGQFKKKGSATSKGGYLLEATSHRGRAWQRMEASTGRSRFSRYGGGLVAEGWESDGCQWKWKCETPPVEVDRFCSWVFGFCCAIGLH